VRNAFLKVYGGYAALQVVVATAAGVCTFAIMVLIVANALSRKALNMPIPAATELTSALLVAVIMLPFAYTQLRGEHVSTVVLTRRMSRPVRRALHIVWLLLGCVLFLAVTWGTWRYAHRAYTLNEQVWAATIQFPIWPSKMSVSVGTFMLAVQFLLDAIHAVLIDDGRAVETDSLEVQARV
jgi:TRAP-type C4-dicarboxylate transport system permease small subunit